MAEREARPSPEALLDAAKHEGRGRLKIFLGAAPGVGKTYDMLLSAQAKRRDGVDVVGGFVETHGRRETEALLEGLDAITRQQIEYKGHLLAEMDLDAILKRRPQLVLVDELAHTNAPGSRHPKRYLDVEEIIAAGIDVFATLNIQHVESLNDAVARITRIRVRETVPDSILDQADEIEVVDLTPDDLIQRLREGKVYVPHQAERALRHYFAPGNLTALRELALRRTAQRVDEQMLTYMRAHAIPGPWAAGDRLLVCVSESPASLALVRHTRRVADRLGARWTAIYVETARYHRLTEAQRDRIAESLRLAEKLGAETLTIPWRRIAVYTFTIRATKNAVAPFFFLVVATLTSNLTARTRSPAVTARKRAQTTAELYAFSRKLAGIVGLDDLLWATSYQIASMLRVRVVMLLPENANGSIVVRGGYPPEDELDEADLAAARWSWDRNRPAGRGADTLPRAKRLFLPLRTRRSTVGVLGIDRDAPGPLLTPDEQRLLDALADQAAVAIERINLVADVDEVRVLAATERLRSALVTTISHDLRTPLASILGSVTSLRSYGELYDQSERDELIATIQEEAERLNRFVTNLLDMTRLEAGVLETKSAMIDLSEVVGTALQRAARVLENHRVTVDLEPDLPMVRVDFVLFEQVLFNLLDNAAKYAPSGSAITLRARRQGESLVIEILDEGGGIPPEHLAHIFEKFYRIRRADRQRAGTGLGLAICRGFVEAIGGTAAAANRSDRAGAVFTITLPVAAPSAAAPAQPERVA